MSLIKDVFALINCLSFALWTITGVSISGLLVLRWKFPIATRPVKVALFVPVVFATCCLFLILVPAVKIPMQSGNSFFFFQTHRFQKVTSDRYRAGNNCSWDPSVLLCAP